MSVHLARIRRCNQNESRSGAVLYWMSREQRVRDNWALLHASELAYRQKVPLHVLFCLRPHFLYNTARMVEFLLQGLEEVEQDLRKLGIPLFFTVGEPVDGVLEHVRKHGIGQVVCDMHPLRWHKVWVEQLGKQITIPLIQVDAHNVVPVWHATTKQEYAAYTLRPKLQRLLPEFLTHFPTLDVVHSSGGLPKPLNWQSIRSQLEIDLSVPIVRAIAPGEKQAWKQLKHFLQHGLSGYATRRNDPNQDGQSGLSPYLHFGQLSAQQVALEVQATSASQEDKHTFLEELIVRRELADNFCWCNTQYDSTACFPAWAKKTLAEHAQDLRLWQYTYNELQQAQTHDLLWNAAQNELLVQGKMHGYLRMYWAKKLLEWTQSPEQAMEFAIRLNDTYSLDGRDPNGYAGIAWSIGGVHDRPWFPRPIFGCIRCMSESGARKKFDVTSYIARQLSPS